MKTNMLIFILIIIVTCFSCSSNKKIVVEDQTDKSIIYINIPFMPNLDELQKC